MLPQNSESLDVATNLGVQFTCLLARHSGQLRRVRGVHELLQWCAALGSEVKNLSSHSRLHQRPPVREGPAAHRQKCATAGQETRERARQGQASAQAEIRLAAMQDATHLILLIEYGAATEDDGAVAQEARRLLRHLGLRRSVHADSYTSVSMQIHPRTYQWEHRGADEGIRIHDVDASV